MNKYQGALPSQHIKNLIANKFITADTGNVKPASLDLMLDEDVYKIPGSFQLPKNTSVFSVIKQLSGKKKVSFNDPLEKGCYYIAKIQEKIDLRSDVYAYANPKSTSGRLDMFIRLLADGMSQYDALSKGFKGDIWIQIQPQSFHTKLHPGDSLNQTRFFYSDARLTKMELEEVMQKEGLLFYEKEGKKEQIFYKEMSIQDSPDSILLCLDVKKGVNGEAIGYRAKKTKQVLDYRQKYRTEDFFTTIESNKNGMIYMPKDSFNILSSVEHVSVPVWLACEMASIDDRLGNYRSHYAGYIDSGWFKRPLTLEVRTYENTFAYHGQPIARIKYERLAELPEFSYETIASNYTKQSKAKLAKQFI